MKVDEHNTLIDKSKKRKDGVYSWSGYLYAVRNGCFVAYADCFGNIFFIHGAFRSQIGVCERWDRRKKLTEFLKSK